MGITEIRRFDVYLDKKANKHTNQIKNNECKVTFNIQIKQHEK